VVKHAKYHSSQLQTDQYSVETVTQKRKETKHLNSSES
jgi:hypothetical protein